MRNKRYLRRKLWYSAFWNWKVWGRGIIRGALLPPKHILLNFMAAQRVFDFLPPMNSLGGYFKDTITFKVSFQSWIPGLSFELSFVSVQALVPSKFWTQRFSGINFYTLYIHTYSTIPACELQFYGEVFWHLLDYLNPILHVHGQKLSSKVTNPLEDWTLQNFFFQ